MARGTAKLFARKKETSVGGVDVTDDQRQQAKGLFGRVTRGEGPGGKPVTITESPMTSVEPSVASPGASPRVIPTESPSVVADAPEAQEKVAEEVEDDWTDDSLALVIGESVVGMLGEKLSAEKIGIYQSEEPHPVELFEALTRDFDRFEWALWEPEALAVEITEISGSEPSEIVRNMFGALASLVESEAFWNEHHVFLWTAEALNGSVPNFAILPDLAPEEVAFAVGVAGVIRDHEELTLPDGSKIPGVTLSDQVLATIAAIWHMNGLLYAPAPLESVNEHLSKMHDAASRALAVEVGAAWGKMGPDESELDDSVMGLQLVRLQAIREYVRNPYA